MDRLSGARSVVFFSARDLGLRAGLPDVTQQSFEGLPYSQLAVPTPSAQQWRWIRSRQQVIESPVHRLLAELQQRWPMTAVVTTATDGLHRLAGSREVLELYGSVWRGRCIECNRSYALNGLPEQDGIPLGLCAHWLRPDIVWPGEWVEHRRLDELFQQADAVVGLGEAIHNHAFVKGIRRWPDLARVCIGGDIEAELRSLIQESG